ncbi:MAG TPA: DUF4350 domain-containing protein [Polyangium sp.]|nr:DUF4350 domain-containing protein [Polyangium sp.]
MMRVLLLLAAFTPTPATSEDVQAKDEILSESRYRFCHEDDYPLIESERGFCPFINKDDESCPSLVKACQQEPKEVEDTGGSPIEMKIEPGERAPTGRKSGADDRKSVRRVKTKGEDDNGNSEKSNKPSKTDGEGADSEKPGEKQSKSNPDEPPKTPENVPPPPPPARDPAVGSFVSFIARILFFALLAAFIVFIVRMIIKNVLADSDAPPEEVPPDEAAPTAQTNARPAIRGVIETDVERLLARARAAAQRGAFAQAIDDLYAALLRRLDGDGIIDIQPFRTNGDYLRDVRRERVEIASDVRAILSDVESVHFGSRSPSAELFSRIHDRVVPLVTKALGVFLFITGISSIVSCGHLAATDSDEQDVELSDKSVFRGDASPSGIHAISTLLEGNGIDMVQHRRPLEELPDAGISTLVLLPSFDIDDIGERRLRDWVKRGGHLVIAGGSDLPDWTGAAFDPEHVGTGSINSAYSPDFGNISMLLPPGPLVKFTDARPVLQRASGHYAGVKTIEDGQVFVFADDRWFMNIALTVEDNAAFLISFFGAVHRNVHVLDGQTSLGANNPIESMIQSNVWPIILQLLALLVIAALWRGRAFGALRDPLVERRRAFADHARALGLAYARSGASRHVLGIYAGWVIERLRERLPREGRRGLSGLAEALATRMGKSTGEVMTVLVDVTDAQKEAAPMSQRSVAAPTRAPRKVKANVAADFALFRALDQWLASTSREQKSSSRSNDKKTKRSS